MRIRWTIPAADDLERIKDYLQSNSPHLAEPMVRGIYKRIQSLKQFSERGRPGYRAGTRELVLNPMPYVVVYRVNADAVEILHIHHGSQDWRGNS